LKQLELAMSIQKYEISKEHVHAALKFKLFGKQQRIAAALDSGHRVSILRHYEKVKENRDILKRLVDMTLYLSTQELTFRGHDETETSLNQGNFKKLAKLLSTYDEKFKTFLNESSVFSGLSKTIQNELIGSITKVIVKTIESEVDKSVCFSWQVDETTDISCLSHLSVIFRYAIDGKVIERFMGFSNLSEGRKADDLFNFVVTQFKI
jgi:hypothetical protein